MSKIILLDEPALKLHPKGKKEFVRIIEQISQKHQIIYTSHSPFLINRNYPHRIRVLKKDTTVGSTIIDNKPYADGTRRCWEPLKTSIGVCLGDFLSFGMSNLIVEGISDQILLSGFSHKLAHINEEHVDLEKISIYPSEGSNNVLYRAKFAYEEELNPIILLDSDQEGKKAEKKAKEKLKDVPRITISQIDKKAKTTEDLIPINLYLNATNTFYNDLKLDKYEEIKEDSLDRDTLGKSGIVVSIHKHFEQFDYSFDKTAVAKELVKSVNISKDDLADYEKIILLFQTINSTLK
jgi:predicted ATP-dependent endonuclease of OLD family